MSGVSTDTSLSSRPCRRLRTLLERPGLDLLLEAHDPVSALLVESAGIEGVWASSFSMSARWGVPDSCMLSRDHVLSNLEYMTRRLSIPVLFDGDNGYGDSSHFIELIRGLCLRGVAGVCVEDKRFPKRNSFVRSSTQFLEDPETFAAKISAGRESRADPDFVVVARTEALIVGLGVDEALSRARLYAEAGADAVLVHSKRTDFREIAEFMQKWDYCVPVISVPTKFPNTPLSVLEKSGLSLIIWANHMLRASVRAMAEAARHFAQHRCSVGLPLVSLEDIFALQGESQEMHAGDLAYVPCGSRSHATGSTRSGFISGGLDRDPAEDRLPLANGGQVSAISSFGGDSDSRQVCQRGRVPLPVTGCADILLRARVNGIDQPEVQATVHGLDRRAVVVLPYDPVNDVVVLVEQLRPGAWAAGGSGWVIEVVAGVIEAQQTPEQAAHAELLEEIHCVAHRLIPIRRYLPNPADSAVEVWQYCALVDASALATTGGKSADGEVLWIHCVPASGIDSLLADPRLSNAATLLCLQWLALHRDALRSIM